MIKPFTKLLSQIPYAIIFYYPAQWEESEDPQESEGKAYSVVAQKSTRLTSEELKDERSSWWLRKASEDGLNLESWRDTGTAGDHGKEAGSRWGQEGVISLGRTFFSKSPCFASAPESLVCRFTSENLGDFFFFPILFGNEKLGHKNIPEDVHLGCLPEVTDWCVAWMLHPAGRHCRFRIY